MVFHRIRSGRAKRFPGLLLKYKQVEISANIFGGKTNKSQPSLDLGWFWGCGIAAVAVAQAVERLHFV